MPRDKQPREPKAAVPRDSISPLLQLPHDVLLRIVGEFRLYRKQHPLLAVCRATRDLVLQHVHKVEVTINAYGRQQDDTEASIAPLSRLLHRVCSLAAPGLEVHISVDASRDNRAELARALLQPGIQCGGWRNVHTLAANVLFLTREQGQSAFPALQALRHSDWLGEALESGAFFVGLEHVWPQLHTLDLADCKMSRAAVRPTAHALASMPGLRAVSADEGVSYKLVSELTQLTSLTARNNLVKGVRMRRWVKLAVRNPQLTSFTVNETRPGKGTPIRTRHLKQLLKSCLSLTELKVVLRDVDQKGLDILLRHGKNITKLHVNSFQLAVDGSRSEYPCKWEEVTFRSNTDSLLSYINLPLRGVHLLGHLVNLLELPVSKAQPAQVPALLNKAATNLAACPGWQKQAPQFLGFSYTGGGGPGDEGASSASRADFDAPLRLQLLESLAPFMGRHVKTLNIRCRGFQLGRAEVAALGRTQGGTLMHLVLNHCRLTPGFWPAVRQTFPHLSRLWLLDNVEASAADLVAFCTTRAAAIPPPPVLQLQVYEPAATRMGCNAVMSTLKAWGLQGPCVNFSVWRRAGMFLAKCQLQVEDE